MIILRKNKNNEFLKTKQIKNNLNHSTPRNWNLCDIFIYGWDKYWNGNKPIGLFVSRRFHWYCFSIIKRWRNYWSSFWRFFSRIHSASNFVCSCRNIPIVLVIFFVLFACLSWQKIIFKVMQNILNLGRKIIPKFNWLLFFLW